MEKFYLPWSKSKVNVVTNDFCDQLEKILHDPRFNWNDFLFFDDDNPFAPPPENISTIGDINTGEAYLKTYEKLITNPKRQLLVPILFYIDGAVTGQYDKLKVESLQFCPGILNYKAREQSYAWAELGYVANYNKEDSRGKKLLRDSAHMASHSVPLNLAADEGGLNNAKKVNENQDWHSMLDLMLRAIDELRLEAWYLISNTRASFTVTRSLFFTLI